MRDNLTELVIILDRSGSMATIARDMEGGLRTLIEEQQREPGEIHFTFVLFDDPGIYNTYAHHPGGVRTNSPLLPQRDPRFEWVCEDSTGVPAWNLIPRGNTPLYDAVGTVVTAVGARLAKKSEVDRPGRVAVVVVTDGYENASKEWTSDAVQRLVKDQQEKWKWAFTFLGCAINAWGQGGAIGINASNAASYTPDNAGKAMGMLSSKMSQYRGIGGQSIGFQYSEEEREQLDVDSKARNDVYKVDPNDTAKSAGTK